MTLKLRKRFFAYPVPPLLAVPGSALKLVNGTSKQAFANLLPSAEAKMNSVTVYSYSDKGQWLPIVNGTLKLGIELSNRTRLSGAEVFVFPAGLNPNKAQPWLSLAKPSK
ncbi:hypothetical protein [Leptolyngbya sp. FACHB-261]|uniref:hypothetical protein n=1 Tax=Leptolyngbya sp. FACHB-261 TaxID=2692806 RepID=UPI001684803D|nr:hypothetical protein [Leptolyngbya sp. FACHB-261]MBD2100190.1 hypothetical protein [Leptolyngbya sp. FACHB-261]